MKKIIVVTSMLILNGCMPAFPKFEAVTPSPNSSTYEKIDLSTYDIGKIQEKTVGESILTVASGRTQIYNIYKAAKTYQPPDYTVANITSKSPAIIEGSNWTLYGTTAAGDKLYTSESFPKNYCLVSNANDEFYGISGCWNFYAVFWPNKVSGLLKTEKMTKYEDGSFKQEILYNGKSKDTIKLQYREYNDNFARPAFFQELSYDLSESKEIGFKGMIMEVIEATNSKIRFIVKSKMH